MSTRVVKFEISPKTKSIVETSHFVRGGNESFSNFRNVNLFFVSLFLAQPENFFEYFRIALAVFFTCLSQ